MKWKPIRILVGGLLLFLKADRSSSAQLHCWKCTSARSSFNTKCKTLDFHENEYSYVLERCNEGQVCFKDVIFYETLFPNGSRIVQERYKRGCIDSDFNRTRWSINHCNITLQSPPFSGERCLCNDASYCNGALGYETITGQNLPVLFSCIIINFCRHLILVWNLI